MDNIYSENLINIDMTNPFASDDLFFEKFIKNVNNLILKLNNTSIVCVNGNSGSGKTTFLKMWNQYLKNDTHVSVYFNIWENNFQLDFFTNIIKSISDNLYISKQDRINFLNASSNVYNIVLNKSGENIYKMFMETFLKEQINQLEITKEGLTSLSGNVGYLSGSILDYITKVDTSSISNEFFKKDLANINNKDKAIDLFKKQLDFLIKKSNSNSKQHFDKPMFIFIDDLDMCLPEQVLENLKIIKFLFDIKNLKIIISADVENILNSIEEVYGSKINPNKYFNKFFHMSFDIPEQTNLEALDNYLDKNSFLNSYFMKHIEKHLIVSYFLKIFKVSNKILEKILLDITFIATNSAINCTSEEYTALILLLFYKHVDKNIYKYIKTYYKLPENNIINCDILFDLVNSEDNYILNRHYDASQNKIDEISFVITNVIGSLLSIESISKYLNIIYSKDIKDISMYQKINSDLRGNILEGFKNTFSYEHKEILINKVSYIINEITI